jgi:hypothetical protein
VAAGRSKGTGVHREVEKRPVTRRLMTHLGVGPLTALAYELVIGTPERFHCGKAPQPPSSRPGATADADDRITEQSPASEGDARGRRPQE